MNGLRWETIAAAGHNAAIDAIVHFPTMDAHRTVLVADHGKIRPAMRAKMNAYWGDASWMADAYTTDGMLPLAELSPRKREPEAIIAAFSLRASHSKAAEKVMRALEKRFI